MAYGAKKAGGKSVPPMPVKKATKKAAPKKK